MKPDPKRKLEVYHNLHKDKLAKFLKKLENYRVKELKKTARRKKNLLKESEVKCPIKSEFLRGRFDHCNRSGNHCNL